MQGEPLFLSGIRTALFRESGASPDASDNGIKAAMAGDGGGGIFAGPMLRHSPPEACAAAMQKRLPPR